MEFYLKYDGPLKSNGDAFDKHQIRQYLHPQLKKLWDIEPLRSSNNFLKADDELSVLKKVEDITFAPLVSSVLKFICELDIILLWPEEQGLISDHGGDIDNRLKTLFDALQCPNVDQIISVKNKFSFDDPFFVLLENDKLITSVNIKTGTLLNPPSKADVSILIHVKTKAIDLMVGTIGLSG